MLLKVCARWAVQVIGAMLLVLGGQGIAMAQAQTPAQGEVYTACMAPTWNLNYHYPECTRATPEAVSAILDAPMDCPNNGCGWEGPTECSLIGSWLLGGRCIRPYFKLSGPGGIWRDVYSVSVTFHCSSGATALPPYGMTCACPAEHIYDPAAGICKRAPIQISLEGPTQAQALSSGGQPIRLVATVSAAGTSREGIAVNLSMQGDAGGRAVALGASDASGRVQIDYTPPYSLVGRKVDKLRADCGGCANAANAAISVQGSTTQQDSEAANDPGQCTRHPILPSSGTKVYSHTDLVDGGAHPLTLERRYASRWDLQPQAGLGAAWSHNHAHRIQGIGRYSYVQYGDGSTSQFLNVAPGYSVDPAVGGGTWSCPANQWCTPVYAPPPAQPPAQWQALGSGDTMVETPSGIEVRRASDDSTWLFDTTTGQALSWRQRNGWTYQYGYTGGRLTSITNAFGRTLTLGYDTQGRLVGASGPMGPMAYGWDAQGRLAVATHADGTSRQYLYEDVRWPNAVTAVVNEAGVRWNNVAYDAQGRATLSELAGGADRTSIAYGAGGTAITDALNTTRNYVYQGSPGRGLRTTQASAPVGGNTLASQTLDGYGLTQSETDYLGITTLFTWDAARRLPTAQTKAAGRPEEQTVQTQWHPTLRLPVLVTEAGRSTAYTYDANGNKLGETVKDLQSGQVRTWVWTYDARGLVSSLREPGGGEWSYVNGPLGLPVRVTNPLGQQTNYVYDEAGRITRIVQATLAVRDHEYDARGRLVAQHIGQGATRSTTRYTWTATGQLQSVTGADGYAVSYGYDAAQRLVAAADNRGNQIQYTLDGLGNRVREETKDASGAIAQATARTISSLNQTVAVHGALGQTTQIGYDANGQAVSQTDALNQTTRRTLDGLSRPVATTFADNTAATQVWNQLDQLTQVTDPKGVATQYTYNGFGEVVRETSPDAGTTVYERDVNGRVVKQTDARGVVTLITRDALGRPVQISRGAKHQTEYTWDGDRQGYLARVEDPSGSTEYVRDPQGRVMTRTQAVNDNPSSPAKFTTRYAWVGARLEGITYPSGLKLAYRYDATGQIVGLALQPVGAAQTPIVSELKHTALGQPRSWRWSNGDAASRTFDADGRMTANEFASYVYDAGSRITGITQHLWASRTVTGVVTQYTVPLDWTVEYDRKDRITGFKRDGAESRYTYDANSNRLTSVDKTSSDMDLDGDFDAADYSKTTRQNLNIGDGTNRLLGFKQTVTEVRGTRTISAASTTVTYKVDAAGNLSSDGLRNFRYDAANRMDRVRIVKNGEEANIDYLHNAFGQRVFKGEPEALRTLPNRDTFSQGFIDWLLKNFGWMFSQAQANTSIGTAYVYGDGVLPPYVLMGEYDNGSASGNGRTEYIWLPAQDGSAKLMGIYRNGRFFSIHTDHLGTPRLMKNDQNKVVWQRPYSAFGTTPPTGVLQNTGKPKEAMTNEPRLLKATAPAQALNLRESFQYEDAETGMRYNLLRTLMKDGHRYGQWTAPGLVDRTPPQAEARSNASGLTPPRWLWRRVRL